MVSSPTKGLQISDKVNSGPIGHQPEEEGRRYGKGRIYDGFEGVKAGKQAVGGAMSRLVYLCRAWVLSDRLSAYGWLESYKRLLRIL